MPENPILERMLDRLYASLVRGPSLNARPHNSRQRIDVTQLEHLGDGPASRVLVALMSDDKRVTLDAKVPMPEGYNPGRWGKKASKKESGEGEIDQPQADAGDVAVPMKTPEQVEKEKAQREAIKKYTNQRSLLTKLRNLGDDARTYEQDTGVSVLALGYPMLSLPPGTIGGGSKRILAPIAMVPVDLAVRSGARSGVSLACREDGVERVQPNAALMAWLERETKQPLPEDLFADEEGEQPLVEIKALIEAVAKMLNLQGIDAEALIGDAFENLQAVPRSDDLPSGPAILPSAVVGLYPVSNQGLMRDMRRLIEQPTLDGPIRPFIDSTASLAVEEHDLAEAEATAHKKTRRFEDERFVAMADPCQAETVRRAYTETGLVIHGPPGTGKSQTITNIIGDFLARGQRVLFVCDKRTALDVVYNRLEHLGLGRLCALIHDPQRDQKDLYMGIRGRLEELADLRTAPRAGSSVKKIDSELQSIHDELTSVYEALMGEDGEQASFHERVGQWLTNQTPTVQGLEEAIGQDVTEQQIEASRADIEVILGRADSVNYPDNPWAPCVAAALSDYLSRSPDEMRRQIAGCHEDARSADSAAHENIPPFDVQRELSEQAAERESLIDQIKWIDSHTDKSVFDRVEQWDAKAVVQRVSEVESTQSSLGEVEKGPLDAELWMLVRDEMPSMRDLAKQIGELGAYIDACQSFLGFLKFAHNKQGKAVLRSYGMQSGKESAERLRDFLVGLRARRVVAEVLSKLEGEADEGEGKPSLPADDVLRSKMQAFGRVLKATQFCDGIDAMADRWRRGLRDASVRQALTDGLERSRARADALDRVVSSLRGLAVFNEVWLQDARDGIYQGKLLQPAIAKLVERFDDLESVLRVREGLAGLEGSLVGAVRVLAEGGVGPEQGVATLQRAVLGRSLRKQAAEDKTLRGLDPERLDRHLSRYLELEADKRGYVVQSILHQWTDKQRERLMVGTRTRLNSDGAALRNRLFVRGKRAMRLRQVISVGQDIEGGDPLFDMCPVWLASPETVAQVFPRKEIFDVVVFDEASQCRLEEALPVLTRATRVVIAGDPKQLPPTRFFEASVTDTDDAPIEDEQDVFEAQLSEVEDLLAAALNLEVQESYLDVHYRSHNADLIGFSNQQFYHDRLQPIPGHPRNTTTTPPIQLHRVNGIYEERANVDEARYVVQLIADLLEEDNPPSIGVATFNLVQRDLISELLDEMATSDSGFGRRYARARQRTSDDSFEGLFVKNLENVQGDERDHIIISTTYGPTEEGRFYKRFGPLRQAGGGRRLNVLVTRARAKVHLVTSIPREVYASVEPMPDGATPNGAWLLFAYLRYAERLEELYEAELKQPVDDAPVGAPLPSLRINPIEPASDFAIGLSRELATQHGLASEAHWGNEGFCIDSALVDPRGPGGVTLGLLTDFNRFQYATDPVAWEAYRCAILQSQGWDLHRVWSPTYLRDTTRVFNGVVSAHREIIESHADQA